VKTELWIRARLSFLCAFWFSLAPAPLHASLARLTIQFRAKALRQIKRHKDEILLDQLLQLSQVRLAKIVWATAVCK